MSELRHPNRDQNQQAIRADLLKTCYSYLRDNFHKFGEAKKIQIALQLVSKDIPNKMEHSGTMTFMDLAKKALDGDDTQIDPGQVQD